MKLFTLVGTKEDGSALFAHAEGEDVEQVEQAANEVYENSAFFILDGHCEAADGSDPEELTEQVENLCFNPGTMPSPFLRAYQAWLRSA